MLSILIPTYNYKVYPLVREIHKQFDKTGIEFEIRVYDDASTERFEENKLIAELPHVIYKVFDENAGRINNRYKLATDARYEYLLFMDDDVFPADRFFASKLMKELQNKEADVYFGGLTVPQHSPSHDRILRWKYGKERESLPLQIRKQSPYRSIICGSICLKKDVFLQDTQMMRNLKRYGLDTLFSYTLKQKKRKVKHYQNPVVHLGLEKNEDFLHKTRSALQTIKYLTQQELLPAGYLRISQVASRFQGFLPASLSRFLYKIFSPLLLKNLLSKQASLPVFDFYKLLYYLQLK